MTHKYYDFYMRFATPEDAKKAQEHYIDTYKSKIGGEFEIYRNGVCCLSLRDDCEIIMDFYAFGMSRFIVADNEHGLRLDKGKQLYEFCTDTDILFSYEFHDGLLDDIDFFLKEKIQSDGYSRKNGEMPPVLQRLTREPSVDDLYDMLDVSVPGLDL